MDKNKSRTDLLAAGRKKLQQFRQKKDSKGGSSHAKSSKKSRQHDSAADADAATSASMSTVSSQVIDGIGTEIDSNLSITESSGSQSFEISSTPDVNDPSDNSLSVALTYNTGVKTKLASSIEVAQRVQGVGERDSELSVQNEGESSQDFGADVAKDVSLRTSDSLGSEGGATNDSMPAHGDILSPSASVTAVAGEAVRVEGEGEEREDSLLLSEDFPKTSWMQTREDQEADGLDMTKYGQSLDAETDNSKKLLSSEVGETAQSFSGTALEETRIEQASPGAEQISELVEVSSSLEGNMSDVLLASAKGQESDTATGESVTSNPERDTLLDSSHEEVLLQSSNEQVSKGVLSGEDRGLQEGPNQQYLQVGYVMVDKSRMLSIGAHEVNLDRLWDVSAISDLSSVNLLQLTEVIRGLSEEEYRFLLKSRSAVSNIDPVASSLISLDHGFPETFQRLKEELFLANCLKDIFNLQVAEQSELVLESDNQCDKLIDELSELRASHNELSEKNQQLIDELSELRASHNELSEKNQHLAEELADCRIELHDVSNKSVEVQNEFNNAKAEVEALSARVIELQNSFEMSRKDSLDLSTELADCRGLVTALQTENKGMNETLALMTEVKNKLAEEKEFHLFEGKKLSTELSDLKNSMEGLKVENSSLSERLSLVTEERSKIEGEIVHLSHEIDRLSTELAKSKDLVASLEVESSNLNGRLALSADQIKDIEEDKHSVVLENQILSSQVIALQEQLSIEQGERMRFKVDLKEATMHLEELTKENIFLNSTLDVHKAKIEEIGNKDSQLLSHHGDLKNQAEIAGEQREDHVVAATEDSQRISQELDEEGAPVGPPLNLLEHEVFDESIGFVSLNLRLDEVEKIVEKLQKAIDVLHSHSASVGWSGDKVAAAGVSKLIQAYESKGDQDEHEPDEKDSSEVPAPADPFVLTKEQIGNLRASLSNWKLDVQNAGALFKWERDGRKNCDAKYSELKDQFEALKQQFSNLEESKVELAVQYEAAMQLLGDIQKKKSHLDELSEALKQEDIRLRTKNNELYDKLGNFQSRISELRAEICDVQQSSNEMASVIGSQLENLQKQVTERAMLLERSWNATTAEIFEAVGKLDESAGGNLSSTISVVTSDGLDVNHRLAVSVDAAVAVVGDLRKKLEAMYSEHETVCISFQEVNAKCDDLFGKNEVAVGILHKIYSDLMKLVLSHSGSLDEEKLDAQSVALPDLLNYNSYQTIMKNLEDILNEKLELESVFKETKSELTHREKELEELSMKCLGLDVVSKLIRDVESVLNVEDTKIKINEAPLSYLELLISSLVQRTREADIHLHIAKEGCEAKVIELAEMQKKMEFLDMLSLEHENEILIFKESLHQAQDSLLSVGSQLHEKTSELEQSEQRVSSIREKLSIAVAKGKGLVVQRDGLKQSLAETSSELERCLQELQLKDSRLHEVETKLKTYAEAGERVEALESELSYIRNSANALRESFLLKDSMLQRIEEILEDLDLPEHFHSRDIIEKIDWLARSAAGNSLPMNDWDQKSSAGGGSYSDTGFVVMDAWKDDGQMQLDSGDDFRRRFEELQSKYYGLAEQNEMLEQSLMERNSLVQRWEQLIERIDMPSHLQSMETEDRIEWLGRALNEANHHIDSLQLKIEKYDSYCGLLNADLEESQRRVSTLLADLRAVTSERGHLSERVEVLMSECEKLSVEARQAELENEKLRDQISGLEEKLKQKAASEEQILTIEGKIRKLQDLVGDALKESISENLVSGSESIDSLEVLLRKLTENYATLLLTKPAYGDALDGCHTQKDDATFHEARSTDMLDKEGPAIDSLKKELEEALHELVHVKEERDRNLERQISLSGEVKALSKRIEELQELLNQEEQKSASVREKLNVAVRKGKSLVQQRDSLKHTIEEMNSEMERLKSEINDHKRTLTEYAQKFADLSSYPGRLEALESESLLLKDQMAETEHYLQEREYTLKVILNKLGEIEVGGDGNTVDPVMKLEWVGKLCSDLHAAVASLEQESRKSKRASELLLAELNEVQERNDAFQEELAKVAYELVDLRKEKDSAEAAKFEALSHLEKLSVLHAEERRSQFSEIMALKSGMNQLYQGFCEVGKLLANALFMDLESFRNIESGLESCMKANNLANVVDSSVTRRHDGPISLSSENKKNSISVESWSDFETIDHNDDNTIIEACSLLGHRLKEFLMELNSLEESLHEHLSLTQEQDKTLSKLMVGVQRELTSQRGSCESMKKEISAKDVELVGLRGNLAYLYEACTNSVSVIEHGKAELVGNKIPVSFDDGIPPSSGQVQLISEESIKTAADRLLSAAKEFASIKTEFLDANQKELKTTVTNLQRELQEKDVQRDRMCVELVNQIKDAEATSNSYLHDLQSSRTREHSLEKKVEEIEAERKILEQRVSELQDGQLIAAELDGKIRSQTDLLAAKDQEIEVLMHALDEEEMQMEEMTKKIDELEKIVLQKNIEIDNLEASRGKLTKKLSITVSKFDELHHLSASLLTEIEKLQSQLQERDSEISFLRQEVTRCTNDVLLASQMSNKRSSNEISEFLIWVDKMISREGMHDMHPDVKSDSQVIEYKEILHKKLISLLSAMDDLRAVAESKDVLLQGERSKVDELTRRVEALEMSLREKESRLNLFDGVEEAGRSVSTSSEILEVEPVINKWTAAGTSLTPQVRSLRKGNNDHVAIAVDIDPGSSSQMDEDDDKVHGFKSLTSSKIVPRFTRPLTHMIDGLWVSCDRALMRQPALRLGIIFYWAIMHALLAFFVV